MVLIKLNLQKDAKLLLLLACFDLCPACVSDGSDECVKALVDVKVFFRRRDESRASEALSHRLCLLLRDFQVLLQVPLVPREDERHFVGVLDLQDFVVQFDGFVIRLARREREHEQEAVALAHVHVAHRGVLLLPRRVEDVQEARHVVDGDLLAVRVLDGRVVLDDELVLHKADGHCRLADASSPDDNDLVRRGVRDLLWR